jgi:hypothetical protein
VAKRLVRWFTFNVVFALFPLITAILFRDLAGKLTSDDIAKSPEILFFAIMLSATALGDLVEIFPSIGWDVLLGAMAAILFIGAVFSAILYGGLVYNSMIETGAESFRSRLLFYSMFLAIGLFAVSTATEVMLGRIEGKK